LENCRTLAIVGLSRDPSKDSRIAANQLLSLGYEVIPVNPYAKTIAGIQCYPSLSRLPSEIAASIELVIIFRPRRGAAAVLDESRKLKQRYGRLKGVWLEPDMTKDPASSLDGLEDLTVIEGAPLLKALERLFHRRNE
jgi:predicted CoA-binding protein